MRILVYLFCLFLLPTRGLADSCHAFEITGLTRTNASLTLGELIDQAAQGFPEMSLVQAKSDEAAAYRDYADSLFAGSHVAQIGYLDHEPIDGFGQKQFDFSITVQPWQWGENSAVERIANAAGTEHKLYREFVRYSVAGLVRDSLWRIALACFEREKVMQQMGLASDLLDVVTTRVRSGDLGEADLLLARSDFLASKAELIRVSGKLGHVVYAYQSITGVGEIPGQFEEVRHPIATIDSSHIAIRTLNMLIEKEKAKIALIRYQTNSQFLLGLGYIRQQETWGSPAQNSLSVAVDVPFGAPDRLNTEIASSNAELNEVIVQRDMLLRNLRLQLQEASRHIEVGTENLQLAEDRAELAKRYIDIQEVGFRYGEISLSELLTARKHSFEAIYSLKRQRIVLNREIALYNQVAGVLP